MGRTEITAQGSGKDWKRILPGLAVSAVCLAVVFYFADLNKLGAAMQKADYRLIAAGIAMSFLWLGVRGIVWRTLLPGKTPYKTVFFTVNEGYLLNNLLPFRLGEVARAFLLSRKVSLDFWEIFSTIVIERALDLAMAAGLLLITLSFVVGAAWAGEAALAAGGLVLIGLLVLYLLARNREWALGRFEALSQRWPLLQRLLGGILGGLLSGLSVLTDGRRFLSAVAWILLNWIAAVAQYFVLMRAFFPSAPLLWAAFTLGVAALGVAAPSSPGALGVYEAAVAGALAIFHADFNTGVAFAFTAHLLNYLITGLLGAYGLVQDGESLTSLYSQLRRMPESRPPGA